MQRRWITALLFATVLAFTAQAHATGPLAGDLPPGAAWMAQFDLARLDGTAAGARLRARLAEPDAAPRLDAFQAVFRFDPRTDLRSVQVFGASRSEEDAVAIVHGAFDGEHLATVLRGQRSYRQVETGSHRIHAWTERISAAMGGPRSFLGAFPEPGVFVFGRNAAAVVQALDLYTSGTSLLAAGHDAFFSVLVDTARLPAGGAAEAAILRYAQTVAMEIGGDGENLAARLRLTAASADVANNLKNVVDGMLSVLLLQAEMNPDLAALARTARVAHAGNTVTVEFSLPLDVADRMIRDAVPGPTP